MIPENKNNIAIIGGGLAGLALSIQLAKKGLSVILFEKEKYPFHRVCGEYISMESWDFLCGLGLDLPALDLPRIMKLNVSAPNGNSLSHTLNPGGFGISRYKLDALLADIAVNSGVQIIHTTVTNIEFHKDEFTISTRNGLYTSNLCFGTFGKRSNIDIKLKRTFVEQPHKPINNYIGIKYHIKTDFPGDLIELHNFKDGYCGISKIEDDRYCLCYMTTAQNLRSNGNNIKQMEETVLMQNPHLERIFKQATFLYEEPLAISQISFSPKNAVENHIIMLGDAAGLIPPLCGNGMSMAFHASKIATELTFLYVDKQISRSQLEGTYISRWNKAFKIRITAGRLIQGLFGKSTLTNFTISILKRTPSIVNKLVGLTHGENF